MLLRAVGLIAVCGLLITAPTTDAAPRRSCNLVTDPAGDVRLPPTGEPDPRDFAATDLVSGDVASNATHLTTTIRVRDLSGWRTDEVGIEFAFGFTIGGTRFGLEARRTMAREGSNYFGDAFTLWKMAGGKPGQESWRYAGRADGWFDEDTSQIFIYAELAQMRLTGQSRVDVTDLRIEGKQVDDGLIASGSSTVDNAESTATYRLGSPSCAPAYK